MKTIKEIINLENKQFLIDVQENLIKRKNRLYNHHLRRQLYLKKKAFKSQQNKYKKESKERQVKDFVELHHKKYLSDINLLLDAIIKEIRQIRDKISYNNSRYYELKKELTTETKIYEARVNNNKEYIKRKENLPYRRFLITISFIFSLFLPVFGWFSLFLSWTLFDEVFIGISSFWVSIIGLFTGIVIYVKLKKRIDKFHPSVDNMSLFSEDEVEKSSENIKNIKKNLQSIKDEISSLQSKLNYYTLNDISYNNANSKNLESLKKINPFNEEEVKKEILEKQVSFNRVLNNWQGKNLDVDRFRNGDIIPCINNVADWEEASKNKSPAWCYYNFNPTLGLIYGKLYNWYAVNDPRGLAPEGWHIPSMEEWELYQKLLRQNYCSEKYSSEYLIELLIDLYDWGYFEKNKNVGKTKYPSMFNNNLSGFTALPGGYFIDNLFKKVKEEGRWWTSAEHNYLSASCFHITYSIYKGSYKNVSSSDVPKNAGLSVRCIRD